MEISNIELETYYGKDIPTILVNQNEVLEVILNVILNATESMPKGGKLRIEISREYIAPKQAEFLRVCINDTGCGISEENLSKILTRYFTTKKEGTGLGLAIADRIIKAHGGFIQVESELGKGTVFLIHLPLSQT